MTQSQRKRLLLLATDRYSININDFYMFFRRTEHEIVGLLHHVSCPRKSWWRDNRFSDPARDSIFDPMNYDALSLISWSNAAELPALLDRIDFDYVCMGNGTGSDHQVAIEHVGRDRCLFTEYGWLPWSSHFYIARGGCGNCSDIATMKREDISKKPVNERGIREARKRIRGGWPVLSRGFVYVPLQKDVNDFKFTLTHFKSNEQFLDFVHEIVPKRTPVWVKRHPLYKKEYDFKKYGRFVDISSKNLNKAHIYRRMSAMVCINSTSILEALLFGGNVFAYGDDIYRDKDVVHFGVDQKDEFATRLAAEAPCDRIDRFVSLLLDRQVDRSRCVGDDTEYIENHYWNQTLACTS